MSAIRSLCVHAVNSIWAIGTGRQCHRFIIALARQKTRFIVIAGVVADMRTARVADRLLSKHDGSSYNRCASQEQSRRIAPKIETWNWFPKRLD